MCFDETTIKMHLTPLCSVDAVLMLKVTQNYNTQKSLLI